MKYLSLLPPLPIRNLNNHPIRSTKRSFEGTCSWSQRIMTIHIIIAVDAVYRFDIFSFSFSLPKYYFSYYYCCCYLLRFDAKSILSWISTALLKSFPLLPQHPRSCCSFNLKSIRRSLAVAIFAAIIVRFTVSPVAFSLSLLSIAACHRCSSQDIILSLLSLNILLLEVAYLRSLRFQQLLFPRNCHCFSCGYCFLHRRYVS